MDPKRPVPIRRAPGPERTKALRVWQVRALGLFAVMGVCIGAWVGVQAASRTTNGSDLRPLVLADHRDEKRVAAVALPELRLTPVNDEEVARYLVPDEAEQDFLFEEPVTEGPDETDTVLPVRHQLDPVGTPKGPAVALVIDDLGLAHARTREIADLPARLTLSFLPYADDIAGQTAYASAHDHEIFAHIPMQPRGDEDPGPNALMTWHTRLEIADILETSLSQFHRLSGINNHMGSKFTSNQMSMSWFMGEVKARDLLFVDSVTSQRSKGMETAVAFGLPGLSRDIFIDHAHKGDQRAIEEQLALVERQALERGVVIAIGHPYKETIAALEAWVPLAKARGIKFVTVSEVVAMRQDAHRLLAEKKD